MSAPATQNPSTTGGELEQKSSEHAMSEKTKTMFADFAVYGMGLLLLLTLFGLGVYAGSVLIGSQDTYGSGVALIVLFVFYLIIAIVQYGLHLKKYYDDKTYAKVVPKVVA